MARSRDSVLTLDKVAGDLRVSRATACKLAQKGEIPGQKVRRNRWFRREGIDQWLHGKEARH